MFKAKRNRKKKILLVDDDRSVSQMLKMLLENRGYEILTAYDGAEALAKADETTDLVLLDLILPDQEGFDVCRQLKEKETTSAVPIVILSARVLSGDIVEGLYLGADDYLTKPFEYEELVARMEAVMRRGSPFSESITNKTQGEDVVRELRKIIQEERIQPYFQPIYLVKPMKLFGLEALCRPETESPILSNPELLFQAAFQYGLYQELELLAWKKAIEHASDYLQEQYLFLNCNPYLVEGPKFNKVKSLFDRSNLSIGNVILEITERSEVGDYKEFYAQLERFRAHGFKFAVDDVGGGYASLESIVETKPEVVKIDRHIISNLQKDPYKRSIVKFVVAFCRENNILSIAEGIETREDLDMVRRLGIDAVQGYFLSRPQPKIDVKELNDSVIHLV